MALPSLLASPPTSGSSPRRRDGSAPSSSGRGGGSILQNLPPSRPPVLLQITPTVVLAGTTADAAPKRIFPYHAVVKNKNESVETLYRFWSTLLQQVYDSLGDVKDRRVIVLVADATLEPDYIRHTLKQVLLRVLLQVIGVPAASIQPTLLFLPYAFPMISTMIIVHVAPQNGACFVHSQDKSLPFTFHSIPFLEEQQQGAVTDDSTTRTISNTWTDAMQRQYLDPYYPESLLVALLKTLESCPTAIRGQAVQNIIFTGQGIVQRPDIPLRMGKQLKQLLQDGKLPAVVSSSPPERGLHLYPRVWGIVPVDLTALTSLAPLVGLVDVAATLQTGRADLVPWTGASLWAAYSHQNNPDAFAWISKT